jgi:methylmalonyl-CoA mutase C-terminal domain/subunit
VEEMKKRDMQEVLIIGGGNIPKEDIPVLLEAGISSIFGPGSSIKEIAKYIRDNIKVS